MHGARRCRLRECMARSTGASHSQVILHQSSRRHHKNGVHTECWPYMHARGWRIARPHPMLLCGQVAAAGQLVGVQAKGGRVARHGRRVPGG